MINIRLSLIFLYFFVTTGFVLNAQQLKPQDFKSGDLLFQDLDCGGLCDAIEKVTTGVKGYSFSHVGLVYKENDTVFVIEAIGKDVHLTPLQNFANRQLDGKGKMKLVHGRLKKQYQYLNKAAIKYALAKLSTPYDDAFLYNNGKYYCSELIYDAYLTANKGKPVFQLFPMTFIDPDTKQIFPAWVDYYKALGIEIPEGKPGCNPGGLSVSDKIDILSYYY